MQRSLIVIILASLVGFADSFYLTLDHYISLPLPCSILHGCETVLHSKYSMVGPIPLGAFGVVYYLLVGFLGLYILTTPIVSKRLVMGLVVLSIAGAIMSIGFESLQYFVIHALCQYCALSALCTFIMCGFAVPLLKK
ncbi:MAG: conserved rane protein of unknown function [Candidatus Kaiserbacteria bacterium]|nr:conserved rane protein of unknown function [Candidatus Kaiserbacteria bacterium]